MLLVLDMLNLDLIPDLPLHVWLKFQIIKLQLILLGFDVNLRWRLQWINHCRHSLLTLARMDRFRVIIRNDNSPTAIQSVIHLHLDSGDRISEFEQEPKKIFEISLM